MSNPTPTPTPPNPAPGPRAWRAVLNVLERAGTTFIESFVSLFSLSAALDVNVVESTAIAAIPAGLAVIMNALGAWLTADQPVPTKPALLDYVERFAATFGQTFLGALIVAHHYGLSELEVAGVAALASALSIVKGGIAQLTGAKTPALFGPLAARSKP